MKTYIIVTRLLIGIRFLSSIIVQYYKSTKANWCQCREKYLYDLNIRIFSYASIIKLKIRFLETKENDLLFVYRDLEKINKSSVFIGKDK